MKDFDIEKLDRKNIYKTHEDVFDKVQQNVLNSIVKETKAPIYKLNWIYAVAASIVLILGISFVYNIDNNTDSVTVSESYSLAEVPKTDSQIAYETLKQDILDVEEPSVVPKNEIQKKEVIHKSSQKSIAKAEPVAKHTEKQFTEILDSFSNSEIAELASNSSQDVYLDIFN